jgi:hypothetical protein
MTRRNVSLIVPFALAVLLSTACDVFSSEPVLQVLVTVDPPRFAVGDSSELTVTVVNRSGHRRRVSGGGCLISFQVLDAADNRVAPLWLCSAPLIQIDIERGGTLVNSITWRGEAFSERSWLAPGSYRVFGVLDAVEALVVSSPVTVELL